MAAPVISGFSCSMGSVSQTPAVLVDFSVSQDCFVAPSGFQYSKSSEPGVWHDASVSGLSQVNPDSILSGNNPQTLLWDIKLDEDGTYEQVKVRLNIKNSEGDESGYSTSEYFTAKTTTPSVSVSIDEYVKQSVQSIQPAVSDDVSLIRISCYSDFSDAVWGAYNPVVNPAISLSLKPDGDGLKTIYAQVKDAYHNASAVFSVQTRVHSVQPSSLFVKITGSVPGNEFYTGMAIGADGSFVKNKEVDIEFYASSSIDLYVKVGGSAITVDEASDYVLYKAATDTVPRISTVHGVLNSSVGDPFDGDVSVTVYFRDQAGNVSESSKTIRLNTRVFYGEHRLWKSPSPDYDHQVYELSGAGTTALLQRSRSMDNVFIRRWDEICYPSTHDYPRMEDGTINASACIAMGQVSSAYYDAVQLSGGQVYYDNHGRPVTVDWTSDGTKDYSAQESAVAMRFWIIDNTGYGDIDMQFEYFDLNPNAYNIPANIHKPYDGDCVVIYDASDPGAVTESVGSNGRRSYAMNDSSRLTELYAYTGSGTSVMELNTGYSVGASTNGAFSVPTIRLPANGNRICIAIFSDASHQASGFKIKAGPRHAVTYKNYDTDETNGELWLHKYPDGRSYDGTIRMVYDYYDTDVRFNRDDGTVDFTVQPSGVVRATYSYYLQDQDRISMDNSRFFVSSFDDYVDYYAPEMYAVPSGQLVDRLANYDFSAPAPSGKISSNFTADKDRGLIEFANGTAGHSDEFYYVPRECRLVMDYYHHTYKRLTNDGYGTLTFRDRTVVADSTPLFPDFTWVDVKLVNEGDAILEGGIIKFLSRGYDDNNDGIIDQVLDVNRPWDVQEGTAAETYDKVAMEVRTNYTWSIRPSKDDAKSILSSWKNRVFGFDCYPRTRWYGRVVWILGGTSGNSYPATTVGRKTFSSQIEGRYYSVSV